MDELFKEQSIRIKIYLSIPSENDPYEKDVTLEELPSLPISAIVTDLSFSKVQWSMPAVLTDKAKEIVIEKRHKNLFEQAYKIEIEDELFDAWKINGKTQYKIEQDYLRAYIFIKKES